MKVLKQSAYGDWLWGRSERYVSLPYRT